MNASMGQCSRDYGYLPVSDKDGKQQMKEEQIQNWKIKRKTTEVIFSLQNFLGSINYTIVIQSLWFYLKQVGSSNPSVFFGVIFGLSQVNALIFSILTG